MDDENPFRAWIDRFGLSQYRVAKAIGCSRGAVANWYKNGAPLYILLACAAYSVGQKPLE